MRKTGAVGAVFSRAGDGSGGGETTQPPIDLTHLARQTMNDSDLQREILHIFVEQVAVARRELPLAQGEDRKRLAHKLKGAANAVGAFALAGCAERLMEEPGDARALERFDRIAQETAVYASSLAG